MKKFKEILSLCKCSVMITVNDHRDFYETVEENLKEKMDEIDEDVFKVMVETDTIVKIQAYPRSPTGFYSVYHYDVDKAVDLMLEILTTKK